MEPEYVGLRTCLTPIAFIFTLIMVGLVLWLPRKKVLVPFLLIACFIAESQEFVSFGFHFTMIRLVIMAGLIRSYFKKEYRQIKMTTIDKVFIWYTISASFFFVLREGDFPSFGNRIGCILVGLGMYFLFRFWIQDNVDVRRTLSILAIITFTISLFMIAENLTGRNFFTFLGLPSISELRHGKVRSQGPFLHALLAGAFGATQIPFFTVLLMNSTKKERIVGTLGIIGGLIMIFTTATSSCLFALAVGTFSLVFIWPMRYKMRTMRWGVVFLLIGLQICMKAPVWALIARFDLVGGSTGYHRFTVIDAAIRNFSEWWFCGVHETDHWGYECWDLTNQFVAEGVKGGLVSLVLFLTLFVCVFKVIGRGIWSSHENKEMQFIYWALGCTVVSHLTAFWGMDYFGGQAYIGLYLLLSIISLSTYTPLYTHPFLQQTPEPRPAP
jgi:hypothetical protein